MDDNDVCPLCCEELDISDKQFFPCKCGYQTCMWCWHRIKETESGLCPACRTPYGDDPHEFSAVDMEEVVKANKEKAAAEKREKERLRQHQVAANGGIGIGGAAGVAGMHIGGGSDGDMAVASSGSLRGQSEPPKDRNQLANMRVIRRNLVYAVGLPPTIATEEMLRKPEHFGQYGNVSKIVLNRNHNGNGDLRRASASAYVTFAHKEDALACILALDGFYLDSRNIRASYGTSKYCSAFIKNVRCNNPDCTYLHMMGDKEDMFTKQEIQAGYVTSGRDVLAKQQQLAAANGSRRKVGNGGPSGTGKVPSNPVFPPPTYEEQPKKTQTNLVPPSTSSTALFPPVSSSVQKATTSSSGIFGFSSVTAAGKMARSTSLPNEVLPRTTAAAMSSAVSLSSQGSNKSETTLTPAEILSRQQEQLRKMHPQNSSLGNTSNTKKVQSQTNGNAKTGPLPTMNTAATTPATAASVVAGMHSTNKPAINPPAPHTTLTALTPLNKRAASAPMPEKSKQATPSDSYHESEMKLSTLRKNSTSLGKTLPLHGQLGTSVTNSPSSSISSSGGITTTSTKLSSIDDGPVGLGALGGTILGGGSLIAGSGAIGSIGRPSKSIGENGGNPNIIKGSSTGSIGGPTLSDNIFGGQTIGGFAHPGTSNNTIGGDLLPSPFLSSDRDLNQNQWDFSMSRTSNGSERLFGNDNFGTIGGPSIWGDESDKARSGMPSNGGINFGKNAPGIQNNITSSNQSGSSALASMLGIQLPTGVGTLRDSLWASSTPVRNPQTSLKSSAPVPTPIGSGMKKSHEGVIIGGVGGNVPIGGFNGSAIGNANINGTGNTSDIKLLQSLLPGVHITSGNAYHPAAPNISAKQNNHNIGNAGWGGFPASQFNGNNHMAKQHENQAGLCGLVHRENTKQEMDMWGEGKVYTAPGASNSNPNQRNGSNIW